MSSEYREVFPGVSARILYCSNEAVAVEEFLKAGSSVPMHKHEGVQFTVVLWGALSLEFEGGSRTLLSGGGYAVIPPGVGHSAVALEDTLVIDINAPLTSDRMPLVEKLGGCPGSGED